MSYYRKASRRAALSARARNHRLARPGGARAGHASLPMIFLGALALTRRLEGVNRLPLAALVVYGFAAVAIMIASSMSGFVGADLLSRMVAGDPKLESQRMLLDYTFRINQAFASVFNVGSCTAILLWSVAMLQTRRLAMGLGVYGLVLGSVTTAALLFGVLSLALGWVTS